MFLEIKQRDGAIGAALGMVILGKEKDTFGILRIWKRTAGLELKTLPRTSHLRDTEGLRFVHGTADDVDGDTSRHNWHALRVYCGPGTAPGICIRYTV